MQGMDLTNYRDLFRGHTELRIQENSESVYTITNGKVEQNTENSSGGISARVYHRGVWGFASTPVISNHTVGEVVCAATANADVFQRMSMAQKPPLEAIASHSSFSKNRVKPASSKKEKLDRLLTIDDYIAKKFPDLKSRMLFSRSQQIEKRWITSFGSEANSSYPRAHIYVSLTYEKDGESLENMEIFGGFGYFEELFDDLPGIYTKIDELYDHLRKKVEGDYPKPGFQDVIICPSLGGILAHEAVGHTVEADFVKSGSIAKDVLNEKVASDIVTMVDYAHHYKDDLLPVPVFTDDEGTEAVDAVLIEHGVLKGYMHNLESAQELRCAPTGNARGFAFSDEPLIRMRNTAILPGNNTIEEMIDSIDDGYYLMKTMNGQADSTSEFMFGITQAYEIKKGKLGRALKDFTVSGVAFDMLKTITMLSSQMEWENSGYCGKKQPMIVSSGSPAIKCKMMIGGRE
ncbi:MAG: TldD/PmbA family protein [Thermotogaceae bacterium]|nr:TldD/PmbA family protein [Thermotogaceae bacterium]